MMGLRHVMPSGHEYNRWNLPLDQLPKKFLNYREWGNPLAWDVNFQCHELFHELGDEFEDTFWMTKDYEIELRARAIEDDAQREWFCRNFGGHWSKQHKRFFRFPPKKVEKSGDGKWHEVEDADAYGEEYKEYDHTVIGRALVLSKLEEAAMLRATTSEESFVDAEHSYVDVAGAFDRRINDVIDHWRRHVGEAESNSWKIPKEFDAAVDTVVSKVTRYMETFKAKEVELGLERKKKRAVENDDVWEPTQDELKAKKRCIDNEAGTSGMIVSPSEMRCTRSRAQALKDNVEDLHVGRSEAE